MTSNENPSGILPYALLVSALTLQLTLTAHAEEETKGFQPGKRLFNNPFANIKPEDAEDLDEDDLDTDPIALPSSGDIAESPTLPEPPRPPSQPINLGGSAPAVDGELEKDVPDPKKTRDGIEVGGGPSSGVISNSKVEPIKIDTESGEGSQEIITDFNYPDADILDLAKTMGKLTGKNFILDKDVRGRVTIISNTSVTVGDAWRAFLTALDMSGFTLVPSGQYIRIMRNRDARDKQIRTFTGAYAPETDQLITRLFPLKYISSEEVARTFRSFMPANSRIYPYNQTNTLIVTDTGANIKKLAQMLEFLDVEGYDAGIEVIQVKYASAVELSKLIDTLLPGTTTVQKGKAGPGGSFGGSKSDFKSRRTKGGGVVDAIIADERTNALIILANTKGADQVRALVTQLDKKLTAQVGGGKIHVIYLQFAEAEEIAKTLNALSQDNSPERSKDKSGLGINPVTTTLFEGSIKVSADKATNSLVVTASPSDLVTVQQVINKLDIPRDEVYVEAIIMEMGLSKNFNFSTNLILPTSAIGLTTNTDLVDFLASPISQKGAVLGFAAGNTQTFTVGGESVKLSGIQGLIKALQTNANANILATPQILTLDNKEATFESGEKIPVPTTTTSSGGTVTSGLTRESVSLKITLKPQINKISNFVKLDVDATLEDISGRELPSQVSSLAFATISRSVKTSVFVADEDTVVLGGLVRDKQSETVSKIPILGDIPLLGWLFKSTAQQVEKTNLIIFLTPHIIRHYDKIRAILDKKLRQRDEFLEKNVGGNDPMRGYRDEMIRTLPDIKEVMSYKPQTTVTLDGSDAAKAVQASGSIFSGDMKDANPANTETGEPVPEEPAPEQEPELIVPETEPDESPQALTPEE